MQRLLLPAWVGALALMPLVYLPNAMQPADLPRWLWLQLIVTAASFASARPLLEPRAYSTGLRASLGLFVIALASLAWAGDKGAALLHLLKLATALQWLLLAVALGPRMRQAAHYGLLVAAALTALLGIVQNLGWGPTFFSQLSPPASSFVNRNLAAEFVAALTPLALLLALFEKRDWLRRLNAPLFGACLLYVVLTRSRASWLALAGTGFLLLALYALHPTLRATWPLVRTRLRTMLALAALPLLVAFPIGRGPGQVNLQALGGELGTFSSNHQVAGEKVNTVAVRLALFQNSLGMLADHPFGVGIGNFSRHYGAYHSHARPTPTYALNTEPERLHNDPYQILLELGPLGLALFGLLLYQVLSSLRRAPLDPEVDILGRVGPLLVVVLILLNSLFSFPLQMPLTAALFWFACGLCLPDQPTPGKQERALGVVLLLFNLLLCGAFAMGVKANILRAQVPAALYGHELERAVNLGSQAVALFPLDWYASDELLSTLTALPRPRPQDIELAKAFTERRPNSANGFYRRARLHLTAGQYPQALESTNRALTILGEDAQLYALRAAIHQALGNTPDAKADAAKVDLLIEKRP